MAGALLLYAIRLAWQRLRKRSAQALPMQEEAAASKFSPFQNLVGNPPALPAAERIRLEDYEPAHESFSGAFRSPLDKMIRDAWLAVWYVLATVALVALLTMTVHASALFIALQLPLIALCSYVVWPDVNVARRLPFIWTLTAALALFSYLAQPTLGETGRQEWSNAAGVMMWLLLGYWVFGAARWSLEVARRSKARLEFVQSLELFALLFATWGAMFEITSFFAWLVLSLWRDLSVDAPVVAALFSFITAMKTSAALRYLPLEIVLVSLLVLTALRMKDDHYVPRSLDEFLPIREESFFAPFVMALRIPVWIVIVMIEFAVHFSRLAREACLDFVKTFVVRLAFNLLSFALAPLLFYLGHALMLDALHLAAAYYASAENVMEGFQQFFVINIMMLAALCFYVLAVPLLAARYRRAQFVELMPALRRQLFVEGKDYVAALGQTFSLLGVLAFAIPVVTLLPGKPNFGVFSSLYAVIVLAGFAWYVISRDDEDEEEDELEDEAEEQKTQEENAVLGPREDTTSAPGAHDSTARE